jgi:hypothetical protein
MLAASDDFPQNKGTISRGIVAPDIIKNRECKRANLGRAGIEWKPVKYLRILSEN